MRTPSIDSLADGEELEVATNGYPPTLLLQTMAAGLDVEAATRRLTDFTVRHVPGAEAAGLTVQTAAGLATRAATSSLADEVDLLQYAFGGPCVDALIEEKSVQHADDLAADCGAGAGRWPQFAAAAVEETPVRSMLSFRLAVEADAPMASLNIYATRPRAFTSEALRMASELSEPGALALAYVIERETRRGLEKALESNRRIGAAIGILMVRRRLSQEEAFLLVRKASQQTNRKLRDVAGDVVEQGDLPPLP